jgi:hypothetical protein
MDEKGEGGGGNHCPSAVKVFLGSRVQALGQSRDLDKR